MTKTAKILRITVGVACAALLLLLALGCLDIYIDGNSPENLDERGLHIEPVFSAAAIAERLEVLAPMLGLCLFVIVAAALAFRFVGGGKADAPERVRVDMKIKPVRTGVLRGVRIAVPVLAVLFIVLGVMNGGARDVLVKAINICTECIGLG